MINSQSEIEKPAKRRKAVKKIFFSVVFFVFGMLFLAACTRAFTTDADKANQMYAAMYGQDSSRYQETSDAQGTRISLGSTFSERGKAIIQTLYTGTTATRPVAIPGQRFFDYLSVDYEIAFPQGAAVPTINPVAIASNASLPDGLSKPQAWLRDNLLSSVDTGRMNAIFGEEIVRSLKDGQTRDGSQWRSLDFSTEGDRSYYISTFQSAKAIALFGGYENDRIVLWGNLDLWAIEARSDIGYENAPSDGFLSAYESTVDQYVAGNRAGLNTSGNGGLYGQAGNQIYLQNKTWGEAFTQFGFLEGLLIYPIGWMVNTFITSFAAMGAGWAEFLAIFLVTLIVRFALVVFAIFTTRSQNKMAELQPEVSKIQAKYPNYQTDPAERQQMSREVRDVYRKNKVKPWLQMVMIVFQFPIFICVWAALEGSASLSSGNFFGIELTASMSAVIMNSTGTPVAMGPRVLAGCMLAVMFIAQFLSMMTGQWFSKWKTKKFYGGVKKNDSATDPQKMMKWVTIIMMGFMVYWGISLPAGMSMYWFFGALISIFQVFITEAISAGYRHRKTRGDGDPLSAIRRSKHHDSLRRSR